MLRVVFDTNILISAFATPKGVAGKVYDAWVEGKCILVTSEYILNEFARIAKNKLKFQEREILPVVNFIAQDANLVHPLPFSNTKIEPNDWPILGTALAGQADFLITGDKKILGFNEVLKSEIITPAKFLEKL